MMAADGQVGIPQNVCDSPGPCPVTKLLQWRLNGHAGKSWPRHEFEPRSQHDVAMSFYGAREFRVVLLVTGVCKQHIENRHCTLIFSQLIEQARVSLALPQPG